jgi:hypothetical protein
VSTHKNRVKMTVSGTPGTGTITLGSASSGYQSFATAYGGNATVDILIVEGTAWEVCRDCTYTNSGTTVTRGTLEASSTGSAVSFTSAAVVSVIATADRGRTWDAASLNTQVAGTDANTTMAVNTLYTVDMSAWATADRTYTLPATAAVGDRIGVMVTAGNASYELLLTAGTGDTLNGIAGGTEWSRLFIANEVVVMRCIVADTTWVVEYDGRIPQVAKMYLSTAADGETASTVTLPTSAATPGAWTSAHDNASILSTSNSRINARRAGTYSCVVSYAPKDAGTAGRFINLEIRLNGTTVLGGPSTVLTSSTVNRIAATLVTQMAASDYLAYYYRTEDGAIGAGAGASWICTFALSEVL